MTRSRQEFSVKVKAQAAARANGKCEGCGARLRLGGYHYDHIVPDGFGGEPTLENCAVLCLTCHKIKTHEEDNPRMAKADMQRKRIALNIKPESRRKLPGSKDSPIKIKLDGTRVWRATGLPVRREK